MRFFQRLAFSTAVFGCCNLAIAELLDDFPPPNVDLTKWHKIDLNEGRPWGPSIFDTSSGALNLRTTSEVPVPSPFTVEDSGYMALAWIPSLGDPQAYSNGSVRVRFRTDGDVAAAIEMRGDLETFTAYDFVAAPLSGSFNINVYENGQGRKLATMPNVTFSKGEDWWMEASTIGEQISLKAWPDGTPEPLSPQLTIRDTTLTQGGFAIGAGLGVDNFEPALVDVTFDEVSFFVPEPNSTALLLLGMTPLMVWVRRSHRSSATGSSMAK